MTFRHFIYKLFIRQVSQIQDIHFLKLEIVGNTSGNLFKTSYLHMTRGLLFIFITLGFISSVTGQNENDEQNYYDLSLEELMELKVSVASQKALTSRESPSIISIISEEDIISSGARDLIDVLRMIPGLNFGLDVQGVTGLAARGNWGHEGKVLLMIDGQEMNDILYSTTQFGNHYDVHQIKRIEVIRGPGSSIYGGSAELGVINVITKSGGDINGIEINGIYGQLSDTYARRNLSVGFGKATEDMDFSLKWFLGGGQRSNIEFTDIFGDSRDMTNHSDLNPANVNLGWKYKNLQVRAIYDKYETTSRAVYEEVVDTAQAMDFTSLNTQILYKWDLNDKISLTPKFTYINQQPWHVRSDDPGIQSYYRSIDVNYDLTTQKVIGNLIGNFEVNENLSLLAGTEYFVEAAVDDDPEVTDYFLGENEIDFSTVSGFAELFYQSKLGNMTIGTRFVNHSQYGSAFAPRIAYTKIFGDFHVKALYNRAYRAPSIENIITNPGVSPERTNVGEIELGLKITDEMDLNLNFFDITIENPIIYNYDGGTIYENFDQSGSRGLELEYRFRSSWGHLNFNYNFSSSNGKNQVSLYEVDGKDNTVVGIPNSKFNLYGSVHLTKDLTINPTFTFIGKRYGFAEIDDSDNTVISEFDAVPLFNLNIRYQNLFTEGLSCSLGVFDAFDQQFVFIQPYDGFHSPLPGQGREFVIRIGYKFVFEEN